MNIVRVVRNNKLLSQTFFSFGGCDESLISFDDKDVIKDNTPSSVAFVNQGSKVLKLVKPRSWHEIGKFFYGRSRMSKELKGNHLLRSLGLSVANIEAYGYGLPAKPYEYLGFFLMENLYNRGCKSAEQVFSQETLNADERKEFFVSFLADFQLMITNRINFSDLTLSNVFLSESHKPIWIDTGVTLYSALSKKKFNLKCEYTLNRFLRRHQQDLNEAEKGLIKEILLKL